MKVYLSPSNQPNNTYNGVATNERDNCRAIANKVKLSLERCGIEVKIGLKGSDNVGESNAFGADLHLPIHTNAFNKKARGASVLVHSKAAGNMKYATPILNNLKAIVLKQDNGRGISERPDLKELYGTKMVAIYIGLLPNTKKLPKQLQRVFARAQVLNTLLRKRATAPKKLQN